jgi:hypothetical protein
MRQIPPRPKNGKVREWLGFEPLLLKMQRRFKNIPKEFLSAYQAVAKLRKNTEGKKKKKILYKYHRIKLLQKKCGTVRFVKLRRHEHTDVSQFPSRVSIKRNHKELLKVVEEAVKSGHVQLTAQNGDEDNKKLTSLWIQNTVGGFTTPTLHKQITRLLEKKSKTQL